MAKTARFLIVRTFVFLLVLLAAAPVVAWNDLGHEVVARVAWDQMSAETRGAAVELLLQAPSDADLAQLLPSDARPEEARRRDLFTRAAYWSDIVRDRDLPQRHERYHRGDWHYVNHFWETGSGGEAVPLDRPVLGRLVERLERTAPILGATERPGAERAIDLAWILHLVGDVHQPLHNSGRVTDAEPGGDRGGNDFELHRDWNLHSFWDRILSTVYTQWFWRSDSQHIGHLAARIAAEYPSESFAGELEPGNYAGWSKEGARLAMRRAYPRELERGDRPSRRYRSQVLETSERQIALAGYRLAGLLERQLGSKVGQPAAASEAASGE